MGTAMFIGSGVFRSISGFYFLQNITGLLRFASLSLGYHRSLDTSSRRHDREVRLIMRKSYKRSFFLTPFTRP